MFYDWSQILARFDLRLRGRMLLIIMRAVEDVVFYQLIAH